MTIIGSDTFTGSIGNGNSATLSLYSEDANRLNITIDDGTTGNEPAEYTITHRAEPSGETITRYQLVQDESGRTDRSWRFEAVGIRSEIEIENTSGSDATYEIAVVAHD